MSLPTGQTMDWSPGTREAQSRQRFIGAWVAALSGGDPPAIDDILADFGESDSVDFRRDLESIDSLFRQRLNDGGATINLNRQGDPTVANLARGKTTDTVAAENDSRVESAVSKADRAGNGRSADTYGDSSEVSGEDEHAAVTLDETLNRLPNELPPIDASAVTGEYQPSDLAPADDAMAETRAFHGDDTPLVRPGKRLVAVPLPKAVAGYEILGVLGRGGMGVVYKARQPGLKRLVALKMILAGGHASADDLARFRSEAEAVARLQHPNIVQIYEIGEDDGRPYFSLEFVDGESLANKLEGKPQSPREAANIIHVLAQAMAAAHARGIIHRDLKPGNILVGSDGTLKITDFGLAKRLEEEVDGGQTRSGSILGTPDYMSPEQASGHSREIGPPADIYALGAMLYEMLAGRVPLRGASVLDTLQQVVAKEPVSPTDLDPKVPRDLETICLKCLRKDPAKRYPRVDDLAEDLRRFLAGEPILARPVSRTERLWRWCRRNPRLAALSAALVILILFWGVSASAVAWKFNEKNIAIANALDDAEKGWGEAKVNLRIAKVNETEAKHQAEVSEEQAQRAEANADVAKEQHRKAADLFVQLGAHLEQQLYGRRSLLEKPELRALQEALLGMVRAAMSDLAKEIEASNVTDFAMANTCFNLGKLLVRFGHGEEAMRQFQYGYKLVKRVVEEKPDDDLARENLAVMLTEMGQMELALNDDARSARLRFVEAHQLQQAVADETSYNCGHSPTDHHRLLGNYDLETGIADLHLGRPQEALKSFNAALAHRKAWLEAEPGLPTPRSYLSQVHWWLGIANWHLGNLEPMQEHYREALNICNDLAKQWPGDFSFQLDLAEIWGGYSEAKLRLGKPDHARIAAGTSLEHLQAVLAHDPDFVSRQALLAQTFERQALAAIALGEADEAKTRFDEARKIRKDLELVDANNPSWKMASALTLAHCGEHAVAANQAQEVIDKSPDNVSMLLQAARCWAVCAGAASDATEKDAYRQRAVAALQKATAGDYADAVLLETDPELSTLAGDERYKAILAEIKSRRS